jgi:ketosteroid isomerase-like protein
MNLLATVILLATAAGPGDQARSKQEVGTLLDEWHKAAARADEEAYFNRLAPHSVFLGTDATERWGKEEFRKFAHPYFAKGQAWTFRAVRREVTLSPDGAVAWFDEELDTPNLGPARGSGVLVRDQGRWLIVQYNLSVPIPNAIFKDVKKLIEESLKSQAPPKAPAAPPAKPG